MAEVYRRHFIWTERENILEGFLQSLNTFHPKPKNQASKVQKISQYFQD